jgi:hypothetical protein
VNPLLTLGSAVELFPLVLGRYFVWGIFFLIFATVVIAIVQTVSSVADNRAAMRVLDTVEGVCVVIFTLEYVVHSISRLSSF